MSGRSVGLGRTRGLPTTVLVARREALMRLRSRVFIGGTTAMTVLVVVGIVAASLLAGKTTPVRVGFSGGSQALERSFTATAASLGASVTVSYIADVTDGRGEGCDRIERRVRPIAGCGGGTPLRRWPLTGGHHLGHGPGPGPAAAAP